VDSGLGYKQGGRKVQYGIRKAGDFPQEARQSSYRPDKSPISLDWRFKGPRKFREPDLRKGQFCLTVHVKSMNPPRDPNARAVETISIRNTTWFLLVTACRTFSVSNVMVFSCQRFLPPTDWTECRTLQLTVMHVGVFAP
jgi:hypothetical protein